MHFSRRHQIATCFEKKVISLHHQKKMTKTLETKKRLYSLKKAAPKSPKLLIKNVD